MLDQTAPKFNTGELEMQLLVKTNWWGHGRTRHFVVDSSGSTSELNLVAKAIVKRSVASKYSSIFNRSLSDICASLRHISSSCREPFVDGAGFHCIRHRSIQRLMMLWPSNCQTADRYAWTRSRTDCTCEAAAAMFSFGLWRLLETTCDSANMSDITTSVRQNSKSIHINKPTASLAVLRSQP
ncbi:hypothetical protein BSL78_21148 [Apostichopus japonicus]|uniref:Uncharacterized protein n=1 Tax=Stichopus japonicus TaxID=307972 RepID=A0A2G8K1W2_STIJA|nr:hypothetical protein BSL78_21148 [Apostichopus japonicus]